MTEDDLPIDADLDLLESYLDDALDPATVAALRVRLTTDDGLAATLAELRSARAVRLSALAMLEPDAGAIDRLNWRVRGAMAAEANRPAIAAPAPSRRTAAFRLDPWRLARITAAAAACVVLGFLGGRIGRGHSAVVEDHVAAVTPSQMPSQSVSNAVPNAALARGVDVPIVDQYNRVISNQHFKSQDQAQQFLNDLRQASGNAGQPTDGQTHLASEIRY